MEERFRSWRCGSREAWAWLWLPYPPRPGGPLVATESWTSRALGQEVRVVRTDQSDVLVTHLQLPGAQFMLRSRGVEREEFEALLAGLQPLL